MAGAGPLKLGGVPEKQPKKLGRTNVNRLAQLHEIYGKGWWATDIAAIQLDVDTNTINQIVYEARNTDGWVVDEKPINGQRKLFRIYKRQVMSSVAEFKAIGTQVKTIIDIVCFGESLGRKLWPNEYEDVINLFIPRRRNGRPMQSGR